MFLCFNPYVSVDGLSVINAFLFLICARNARFFFYDGRRVITFFIFNLISFLFIKREYFKIALVLHAMQER